MLSLGLVVTLLAAVAAVLAFGPGFDANLVSADDGFVTLEVDPIMDIFGGVMGFPVSSSIVFKFLANGSKLNSVWPSRIDLKMNLPSNRWDTLHQGANWGRILAARNELEVGLEETTKCLGAVVAHAASPNCLLEFEIIVHLQRNNYVIGVNA